MEIIPAVDIMRRKVVRLLQGDPRSVKSYESLGDPISIAKKWEADGAQTIHVIDLDAALGLGENTGVVKDIVRSIRVSTQVGGGVRSLDSARTFLDMGARRVILGSLAFKDEDAVKTLLKEYGDKRIVVALDHLNGFVMVSGWTASARTAIEEAMSGFLRMGTRVFLVTSVARDGTMTGTDLATLNRLRFPSADVIAAGGISNTNDIVALKRLGIFGVVVGKALYEGQISLKAAIKIAKENGE